MNDATVNEIRAFMEQWRVARSRFRDNNESDEGEFDRLNERLEYNAGDWLLVLLDERDRLRKVVEVAREIVHDAEHDYHLATNWATDRLKAALAELGEGE